MGKLECLCAKNVMNIVEALDHAYLAKSSDTARSRLDVVLANIDETETACGVRFDIKKELSEAPRLLFENKVDEYRKTIDELRSKIYNTLYKCTI